MREDRGKFIVGFLRHETGQAPDGAGRQRIATRVLFETHVTLLYLFVSG